VLITHSSGGRAHRSIGKPSFHRPRILKAHGFRWSPRAGMVALADRRRRRPSLGGAGTGPSGPRPADGPCWRCQAPEGSSARMGGHAVHCDACHAVLSVPPQPDRFDAEYEDRAARRAACDTTAAPSRRGPFPLRSSTTWQAPLAAADLKQPWTRCRATICDFRGRSGTTALSIGTRDRVLLAGVRDHEPLDRGYGPVCSGVSRW